MNTEAKKKLLAAAQSGDAAAVKAALDGGADIAAADAYGRTALHMAVKSDAIDVIRLLLEKKAPVNAQAGDLGRTPLHEAPSAEAAKLLLDHGAHVNAKDDFFKATPLHLAAQRGRGAVVRLLLKRGAHIDAKMEHGMTPLHTAAMGGDVDSVRVLLDNGAAINALDNNRNTPLHMTDVAMVPWTAWREMEVVKLLIERKADVNAKNSLGETPADTAARRRAEWDAEKQRKLRKQSQLNQQYDYIDTASIDTPELLPRVPSGRPPTTPSGSKNRRKASRLS